MELNEPSNNTLEVSKEVSMDEYPKVNKNGVSNGHWGSDNGCDNRSDNGSTGPWVSSGPWVEKYRPSQLSRIVVDPFNQSILENILETGYFPNLLFYGPPGTGKTTTIINLIKAYQTKYYTKNNDLIIHLNASDDRGIDIIRNQISSFVHSNGMFTTGLKFVILDEIDYMTKNAQNAFRYLLQTNMHHVRFCLICNYISKIDEGLQNNFMKLRFNQLPTNDIIQFLKIIVQSENLIISDKTLESIQTFYKSDIRSMINFIQNNQDIMRPYPTLTNNNNSLSNNQSNNANNNKIKKIKNKKMLVLNQSNSIKIIDNTIWIQLIIKIEKIGHINLVDVIIEHVYSLSLQYNMDINSILKLFLHYIILHHYPNLQNQHTQNSNTAPVPILTTDATKRGASSKQIPSISLSTFLNSIENALHTEKMNVDIYLKYILVHIIQFINSNKQTTLSDTKASTM